MLQLKKLRKELNFNKEISEMINVLKGVASSEFYRLQKARKTRDQFMDYLQSFFQLFDIRQLQHSFLEQSSLPSAVLLITSDAGFLGKLNVDIVDAALKQCTSASGEEKLIVVGNQGVRYIEETGREFISFTSWTTQIYQLLPCRFLFKSPASDNEEEEKTIIEPTRARVLEYLIRSWLNYMIYGIFWESKLSEWSARAMHLESSAEEIKRSDKKIRLKYFRAVHEISDKNIREILSSRLAMRHIMRPV